MHILIINRFFSPDISPTAQLAGSLARDRRKRGDHVTVLAGREGYHDSSAANIAPADEIQVIHLSGLTRSKASAA